MLWPTANIGTFGVSPGVTSDIRFLMRGPILNNLRPTSVIVSVSYMGNVTDKGAGVEIYGELEKGNSISFNVNTDETIFIESRARNPITKGGKDVTAGRMQGFSGLSTNYILRKKLNNAIKYDVMSFLENNFKRRLTIISVGILSLPVSYVALIFSPPFSYQAFGVFTVAFWFVISAVAYFVFFAIRLKNGTLKMRRPPGL